MAVFNEKHVFVAVGFDLLHEHFEEVGCTHARSGPHLAVQSLRKLIALLVERENELELPAGLAIKFPSGRQLVIIRNLEVLGPLSPSAIRPELTAQLSPLRVKSARFVPTACPSKKTARLSVNIRIVDFWWVHDTFLALLFVKHFTQGTLFDRKSAIQFMLLLDARLPSDRLLFDLLLSLSLSCRLL